MELEKIIELLSYTIPAVVTGAVAYYFFLNHTKNEERKMKLTLLKENQKHALPLRLQAYERMTLFLERISPAHLVLRVSAVNNDKNAYAASLINTISQEYDHNIAQQIYITDKCWNIIIASKNATIQLIKKAEADEHVLSAQDLREQIIKSTLTTPPPSNTALAFIKDEVQSFI